MSTYLAPPEGYDPTKTLVRASHVLRYLLVTYPNTVVTHAQVCEVLGRPVSRNATSTAARNLREGPLGLPIVSPGGGGYVLLVPVRGWSDDECCLVCRHMTVLGTCKRLKGRPVRNREWCWGWEA